MKFFLKSLLPQFINNIKNRNKYLQQILEWKNNNKTGPSPHLLKQNILTYLQIKHNYNILIETGTYLGEMVDAQKLWFNKIISIELDKNLYNLAVKKFQKNNKIQILNGDSGIIMSTIVNELNEEAIFWLDGHYSGGITAKGEKICPIYEELNAILNSSYKHIILIDDLRLFVGKDDYPTIDELNNFINQKKCDYEMKFLHDIIILEKK